MHRNNRLAAIVIGALSLSIVAAYAAFPNTVPDTILIPPLTVTVQPSTRLPPAVQQFETQTLALLFDRNTQTQYTAYADSSITANLESATEIRAIKLHGAAPYTLNVSDISWRFPPPFFPISGACLRLIWPDNNKLAPSLI